MRPDRQPVRRRGDTAHRGSLDVMSSRSPRRSGSVDALTPQVAEAQEALARARTLRSRGAIPTFGFRTRRCGWLEPARAVLPDAQRCRHLHERTRKLDGGSRYALAAQRSRGSTPTSGAYTVRIDGSDRQRRTAGRRPQVLRIGALQHSGPRARPAVWATAPTDATHSQASRYARPRAG